MIDIIPIDIIVTNVIQELFYTDISILFRVSTLFLNLVKENAEHLIQRCLILKEKFYKIGTRCLMFTVRNSVYDGEWYSWYENNKIRSRGNYKNGMKEGIWINYFTNGGKQSISCFKDGMREGITKVYNRSGILYLEGNFVKGKCIKSV